MRPAVIIASLLGVNIALAGTVGYLVYVIKQQSAPRARAVEFKKLATVPRRNLNKAMRPSNPPAARPGEFNWAQIESTDFKTYIVNLRAIKCPEETIQDIIMAEVEKLYGARRRALFPQRKEVAYWLTGPNSIENEWADREKQKLLRNLEKEKQDLLAELLGINAQVVFEKIYGSETYYDFHLSFLPEEKQAVARSIVQKFQDQEQELYQQADPDMLEEDQVKFNQELRRIAAEKQAELAKLLTPAELEKYELVSSEVASEMRSNLTAFDPNEEEFRAIFKLRKKFEEETAALGAEGLTEQTERAQLALQGQIREVLGEGRYQEYQRSQDEAYRGAAAIAERLNMPKETAGKVYDFKQVADQEAQRVLGDQKLSAEQQEAGLRAIAEETAKALRQTLGERGFKAYQRNGGGWVQEYSEIGILSPEEREERLRLHLNGAFQAE